MPVTLNKEITVDAAIKNISGLEPGGRFTLSGLYGSSKAFFLASAYKTLSRTVLAVLPDEASAEAFARDLAFFLDPGEVFFYPSTELLPFDLESPHQRLVSERIKLLYRLAGAGQKPFIAVTSAENLMQKVAPKESLLTRVVHLVKEGEFLRDDLVKKLLDSGYTRVPMVEAIGEMSVRGCIVDIFPTALTRPVRIEFFGDWVESMRTFDVSTQRSVEDLEEVKILPASRADLTEQKRIGAGEGLRKRAGELGLNAERWENLYNVLRDPSNTTIPSGLFGLFYKDLDTVFDYLNEKTLVSIIDPSITNAGFKGFEGEIERAAANLLAKKEFFVEPEKLYLGAQKVTGEIKKFPLLELESLTGGGPSVKSSSNMDLMGEISIKKSGRTLTLKPLADRIREGIESGYRVIITAHNRGQAQRTAELLEGYHLNADILKGNIILEGRGGLKVALGSLTTGFRIDSVGLIVISEEEVFGRRVGMSPPPAKKADAKLMQLQELSEGDFIVHSHHGIGIYRGMKRVSIEAVENDFLLLEYKDGDKLYLPVWRMDLVTRYHGFEGGAARVDKLGTSGWNRTKTKVKKAVERMAAELLKLYAEREVAKGFAFSKSGGLFREFEEGFEYEETPDQARAIEECLKDMEQPKPMDRLVCGDVGYGKTEVAIRAAFKAVLDSKQVALLVPTTVLAQQHYDTFTRRLSAYPVVVDVLSRFRSAKSQKEVLKKLSTGGVDIIIGTHRLVQSDVEFKDLGLIIIDEEHRFGVRQKERLKRLRKTVDVLALSATPIPRTLNMSLASIRNLSIINTPPEDRLAIRTEVMRFDEGVIKEAIEREIKRGGQVFFVHNRIQSMGRIEETLRKILPEARLATAHGQMNEHELEKKMHDFVNGEHDILLSTAIIESGLDIPSANTIIINRADMFGLAELYQLRGRVGRSSRRAYAYFIIPEPATITADARKRLEVLRELREPGSGFKIAAYDLEIRGAGELLGTSQSGRIAEVGFDMYTKILEETISEMKGEKVTEEVEPEINLKVSQYIPDDYIPDPGQRLGLYKRLSSLASDDDVSSIHEELGDRYGTVPPLVENLLRTVRLKVLMKELKAKELDQKGSRLYINFEKREVGASGPVVERAVRMAQMEPKRFRITPEGKFIVYMDACADAIEEAGYVLKELAG
ncbi:MAG: transcription-repair coupling factor [Thermodesulfobacteriota bacterium]|nr:MAG: transcription-repair coupling factor [Thermodesulfobacteriota bacterium]